MAQVYVGIGSNIDRERHVTAALQALTDRFGPLQRSSVYECAAVGFSSAPFYNLVVGFETEAAPRAVQQQLHAIEDANARVRADSFSARTLDLDLLLYGGAVISEDHLQVPRDDILRYAFVLRPLAEIAGEKTHPVTGQRFDALWSGFSDRTQALRRVPWPPAPVSR